MKKLFLLAALVGLSACAQTVPPLNFSVPNVGPTAHKVPAELRSINVSVARPDEQLGMLQAGHETLAPIWKSALEDALNRMAVFQDDAPRKVSVSAKILKIDVPGMGASFTTNTAARYEVIDRATGGLIYTKQIEAEGTTPMDFAFLGVARARESVNRSVQNNIALFLKDMEALDLGRPMFPATPRPVGPVASATRPNT